MKAGEIIGGVVWSASAVAVFGYTWDEMRNAYHKFPGLTGGGVGLPNLGQVAKKVVTAATSPQPSGVANVLAPLGSGELPFLPIPGALIPGGPLHGAPAKWVPPPGLIANLYMAVNSGNKNGAATAIRALGQWASANHVPQNAINAYLKDFPWYGKLVNLMFRGA